MPRAACMRKKKLPMGTGRGSWTDERERKKDEVSHASFVRSPFRPSFPQTIALQPVRAGGFAVRPRPSSPPRRCVARPSFAKLCGLIVSIAFLGFWVWIVRDAAHFPSPGASLRALRLSLSRLLLALDWVASNCLGAASRRSSDPRVLCARVSARFAVWSRLSVLFFRAVIFRFHCIGML